MESGSRDWPGRGKVAAHTGDSPFLPMELAITHTWRRGYWKVPRLLPKRSAHPSTCSGRTGACWNHMVFPFMLSPASGGIEAW